MERDLESAFIGLLHYTLRWRRRRSRKFRANEKANTLSPLKRSSLTSVLDFTHNRLCWRSCCVRPIFFDSPENVTVWGQLPFAPSQFSYRNLYQLVISANCIQNCYRMVARKHEAGDDDIIFRQLWKYKVIIDKFFWNAVECRLGSFTNSN